MNNEFMAFVNDEETAQIIRGWADRQGFPSDTVEIGGADLFSTLLESDAPPKFALVDLDNQEQPVQVAARLVSLCGPSCKIVAIGSANDVKLFRGMLAAGMADYLVKPLSPELLSQTLQTVTRSGAVGSNTPKESKNIIFIGVRGGVGTSTITTNIAWILSHEMKKKCTLLDLDLQFGTSALALDIEPGHGLRDVLSSPQRVDGLMIAGALVSESENFGILSAEESIEEVIHVDPNAIMALLKEMKQSHQAVIIDLPRHMIPTQKRILATAHEIVLVTEMSLVGIRDTLRIRTTLKELGSSARITQVASRISPGRPAAVDEATFTKGAQAKIDFVVPDDHKNTIAASNAGKMLGAMAPSAAMTKVIRQLAVHLMTSPTEQSKIKKAGLLGGLFKSSKEAPKA